jgi:hypothetical protein
VSRRMGRPVEIDVALLERMWREGETAETIAAELGCAVCQVFYWRRKLGLPRHEKQSPVIARERRHAERPLPFRVSACSRCGFRMGPEGHPKCSGPHFSDRTAIPRLGAYPSREVA